MVRLRLLRPIGCLHRRPGRRREGVSPPTRMSLPQTCWQCLRSTGRRKEPGKQIQVILEVTDNGTSAFTNYQRVFINVGRWVLHCAQFLD